MTNSQSQIKDLLLKLFRRFNAIQPPVNQRAPNEAASLVLRDSVQENTDRQADRVAGRGWWWWGGVALPRHTSLCKKAEKRGQASTERHLKELLRSLPCDDGGAKLRTLDEFLPDCCLWNERRHKKRETLKPHPLMLLFEIALDTRSGPQQPALLIHDASKLHSLPESRRALTLLAAD